MTTELDAALRRFYSDRPRRRWSSEVDVGLRWRGRDGSTYRVAWVVSTRELYSVRHGDPADPDRVEVLASVGAWTLQGQLSDWIATCARDEPGSYEWLRERAATVHETVAA
jgi:hypothetical protein